MIRVYESKNPLPKYLAREKALVVDTRDPSQSGKIQCQSHFLGKAPVWITYIMAPGQFTPPKVGDTVYIECENGDSTYILAHGKHFSSVFDAVEYPQSLNRVVPTVAAWLSNGSILANGSPAMSFGENGFNGHAILLDDGQQVYGQAPSGNPNAGIKILSYGGAKIILNDDLTNQVILIADNTNTSTPIQINTTTGNRIMIDTSTGIITIANKANGTLITVGESAINITSSGVINVNSTGKTSVVASEVDLNIQDASYSLSPGCVVTTSSNPGLNVIDTIFGDPVQGVSTVKAGS